MTLFLVEFTFLRSACIVLYHANVSEIYFSYLLIKNENDNKLFQNQKKFSLISQANLDKTPKYGLA